jgi:hypothetical protein
VENLVAIMNDQAAPHMARIIAANAILDRGWGRPPMLEVYEAETKPEEHAEAAHEFIASRLAELGDRIRAENDPPKLN